MFHLWAAGHNSKESHISLNFNQDKWSEKEHHLFGGSPTSSDNQLDTTAEEERRRGNDGSQLMDGDKFVMSYTYMNLKPKLQNSGGCNSFVWRNIPTGSWSDLRLGWL